MRLKLVVFLLVVLLYISCSPSGDKSKEQMFFHIDSTAIGERYIDENLHLEYYPPVDWQKATEEFQTNMNIQISEGLQDTVIEYKITDLYYTEIGSMLSVATIQFADTSLDAISRYKEMVIEKFQGYRTKVDTFTSNDIGITQFLISDENIVNFKLLFYNPDSILIQMDYIVPFQVYEYELPSIESSLGTLKIKTPKEEA